MNSFWWTKSSIFPFSFIFNTTTICCLEFLASWLASFFMPHHVRYSLILAQSCPSLPIRPDVGRISFWAGCDTLMLRSNLEPEIPYNRDIVLPILNTPIMIRASLAFCLIPGALGVGPYVLQPIYRTW